MSKDEILPSVKWIAGNEEKINIRETKWLPKGVIGRPANRDEPAYSQRYPSLEWTIYWDLVR